MELTAEELSLLIGALDSHEYWQLAEPNERNSGYVVVEDDELDETDETQAAMLACRRLAARLLAELASREPRTCVLTGADGENADDCTTHDHA